MFATGPKPEYQPSPEFQLWAASTMDNEEDGGKKHSGSQHTLARTFQRCHTKPLLHTVPSPFSTQLPVARSPCCTQRRLTLARPWGKQHKMTFERYPSCGAPPVQLSVSAIRPTSYLSTACQPSRGTGPGGNWSFWFWKCLQDPKGHREKKSPNCF